jgi:hypothetical protein
VVIIAKQHRVKIALRAAGFMAVCMYIAFVGLMWLLFSNGAGRNKGA